MAKTPSPLVTCNADALSRAAGAICERASGITKNAVLGCMARAIAGPDHDWGFIKNTPSGHFIQPGLRPSAPKEPIAASAPPQEVWVLTYDQDSDWAPRPPRLFASQAAGLQAVRDDHATWRHPGHSLEQVLLRLKEYGEYTFGDTYGDEEEDRQDQFQISLQPLEVEATTSGAGDVSGEIAEAESAVAPSSTLVLFDAPKARQGSLVGYSETFFVDNDDFEAYLAKLDSQTETEIAYLRSMLMPASECRITAEFLPQKMFNGHDYPVHTEGEDEWTIDPDEIDPAARDNDYLKSSRNAPTWIQEWTGPFEVYLTIEGPDQAL